MVWFVLESSLILDANWDILFCWPSITISVKNEKWKWKMKISETVVIKFKFVKNILLFIKRYGKQEQSVNLKHEYYKTCLIIKNYI